MNKVTPGLAAWLSSSKGFTSDSRTLRDGDVFVALQGARSDGHDYIASLTAQRDVRGFVVDSSVFAAKKSTLIGDRSENDFFLVSDTQKAHREIAHYFRRRFAGKIIAVGGSSGKTSCKEFLIQLFVALNIKAVATEKSQNGELGIPKTLEKLRSDIEVAVVEIGIDGPGDMIRHVDLVEPDIAVLTSIGEEHLNLLKDLNGVFREERILFDETLKKGGRCFAPAADSWLKKFQTEKNVEFTPDDPAELKEKYMIALEGTYARRNALLALAVVRHLYPDRKLNLQKALSSLEIPEGRGRVESDDRGCFWIEDHYNANPSSMRAAFHRIHGIREKDSRPLTLVLGDMLDLGESTKSLHRELLPDLRALGADELILIGPEMSALKAELTEKKLRIQNFPDSATAARKIDFSSWKNRIILFKGSRGMALEHIIKAFREGSKIGS